MRVLVVDDELGIREGCRRALTSQGMEVEVAENGPAGLRKLREGSFDVLLVDAMMPGMSGLELLAHARKLSSDLICIIITGYVTVELAVQAVREGANDFIAKPFAPDLLRQVINRELDHQRLRREARRVKDLEEELLGFSRVKAETERLGAMESRFMLTMVHTLRAPVAVLENSLQLIRKGYVPPPEQPAFLERAERRAQELLAILDEVLLLSRLKEGLGSALTAPVSVAEALDSVLPLLRKEAEARNLTLSIEDTASPVVSGKMEYIKALWAHLLNNAIRYTRPGGRIIILLQGYPQEGKAIGTVSDNGIGIAPEEIPRIFEEFYRTEAAKNMQESGTGLGLPIVREIVSAAGGTLEIDSTPGQGSSFRFILPLTDSQPGAEP